MSVQPLPAASQRCHCVVTTLGAPAQTLRPRVRVRPIAGTPKGDGRLFAQGRAASQVMFTPPQLAVGSYSLTTVSKVAPAATGNEYAHGPEVVGETPRSPIQLELITSGSNAGE